MKTIAMGNKIRNRFLAAAVLLVGASAAHAESADTTGSHPEDAYRVDDSKGCGGTNPGLVPIDPNYPPSDTRQCVRLAVTSNGLNREASFDLASLTGCTLDFDLKVNFAWIEIKEGRIVINAPIYLTGVSLALPYNCEREAVVLETTVRADGTSTVVSRPVKVSSQEMLHIAVDSRHLPIGF